MNAHAAARAFARALAFRAGLYDVHVYAHDTEIRPDGEEISPIPEALLPAVFIRVKCEGLAGSGTVGRALIEIDVESQSDESTIAQHSQREAEVRAGMADQASLLMAFQAIGGIELLGRVALIDNDPDTEARAFKTPFTYRAGIRG